MPIERINLSSSTVGGFAAFYPNGTVHTTGISSTTIDVIHLWAYIANSNGAADLQLYIPNGYPSQLVVSIPSKTLVKVLDGIQLNGNGSSGTSLGMASGATIMLGGYVLRITP